MDSWFDKASQYYFTPFSTSHLVMLSIAAIGLLILWFCRNRLLPEFQTFHFLRWMLLFLLISSEFSYQYWTLSNGLWNFAEHVPLHLCGIASITASIGLLTLRPGWIRISFFIGVLPALLALVTPDLPYDYQHFRFWKFFVHHIAISWACLFLALTKPELITWRSVFQVYFLLLAYAAVIGFLINPLTGANYLYLSRLPNATTPLSFFGEGLWYYVNLGMTALLLFLLQFFLWKRFIIQKYKRLP